MKGKAKKNLSFQDKNIALKLRSALEITGFSELLLRHCTKIAKLMLGKILGNNNVKLMRRDRC